MRSFLDDVCVYLVQRLIVWKLKDKLHKISIVSQEHIFVMLALQNIPLSTVNLILKLQNILLFTKLHGFLIKIPHEIIKEAQRVQISKLLTIHLLLSTFFNNVLYFFKCYFQAMNVIIVKVN